MNPRLEQLRNLMPFMFGLILLLNLTHANAVKVNWHPTLAAMSQAIATGVKWHMEQMAQFEQNGALYYPGD